MAGEKPKSRRLKVLEELSKFTEPAGATEIAGIIREPSLQVGQDLYHLGKGGLAQQPNPKLKLYLITDKGKEYIKHPPVLLATPTQTPTATPTQTPTQTPTATPTQTPTVEPPAGETAKTIPSQSDLFRSEGDLLGVGTKKGSISLDVIVQWVERTANLDNLSSVWNALGEMGVASDVKKRWIRLYSQNLPDKEIPPELKAKLEMGTEADIIAEKDVSPKPKRFSIINGEIIGDPEGDYNFIEALKLLAQQKGVPGDQINPLASIIEAMKLGPDMATATLAAMIPLITREPPKTDNTMIQVLQQRIEQLAEDKHKVEMDGLRAEMRSGQKPQESSQEIQALSKQIDSYREQLHSEQLTRIEQQNQAQVKELTDSLKRLEQRIAAAAEGKEAQSKIGLMSHGLDAVADELKGVRADIKPLAQSLMEGKIAPSVRTATEKAAFGAGLDKGIERSKEAAELENNLFFGKGS